MPEFPTTHRKGFPLLHAVPDDGEPKQAYIVTFSYPITVEVMAKNAGEAESKALSVKPKVETWERDEAITGICAGWVMDVKVEEANERRTD